MQVRTTLAFIKNEIWIYRVSERLSRQPVIYRRHDWTPLTIRRKANSESFRYYRTSSPKQTHTSSRKYVSYFGRGHVKLPVIKARSKYTRPNNFTFHKEVGLGAGSYGTGMWAKSYALGIDDGPTSKWTAKSVAISIAMSRFVELARGDTASLGETFGEVGQALDMIGNRSRQLWNAWSALVNGRFKEVYRSLNLDASGINRHPGADLRARSKQRAGDYGGAWLEYWFGWSPLVNDMQVSLAIISGSKPLSHDKVMGRAKTTDAYRLVTQPYGRDYVIESGTCVVRVRVQARVTVSSQPRLLASQLGINNPPLTAWNLVPFSFLVDWFVNVSQFLDSWNWLDGLKLTDAFHTVSFEGSDKYTYGTDVIVDEKFFRVQRAIGMPAMPLPTLRIPKRLSPTRALTSVSLLAQSFASVHTDTTHFGAKHLK